MWWLRSAVLSSLLILAGSAAAQSAYPTEPIRIIVTVAPGGGVDAVTRMVANSIGPTLGKPIVVENRPGAAGNVGAGYVYHSKPDGYTLMASSPTPVTIASLLYKDLDFNPAAFEPVALMSHIPNVLLVRKDFPAKSAKELVAYLKANPGKVTFGSQGVGTASYLAGELFMRITGTTMIHVPYRGTGPLINDVLGGHVDLTFIQVAAVAGLHRAGKVRILAVANAERLDSLPDVPTMAEAGFPGTESETWNAISAPPNTPAPVVAKLNTAINAAIALPAIRARFRELDILPGGGDLATVKTFIANERVRWGEVVKAAGINPGSAEDQ
ncbi:MAG TPA: tripartite tricarboxylate transporter substrate binding protein [Xanthobacteraceae bacterium]|jgi:tripartite-type tricarboxylate transporter receptor subunit TctC|nr:tripartite tricarboxylate transporter substrate binding protein [Xanthobacteraceae bacterium]